MSDYLYKFRSFNMNNLKALTENQLWFSIGECFNDPLDCTGNVPLTFLDAKNLDAFMRKSTHIDGLIEEGYLTEKDRIALIHNQLNKAQKLLVESRISEHPLGALLENTNSYVRRSFVYCLTSCPRNILMWSHYADSHTGFCIRYKKDILLDNEDFHQKNNVDYSGEPVSLLDCLVDPTAKITSEQVIFRKSPAWKYEKEFRIIHKDLAKDEYDKYRVVEHDPNAIDAIYFGLNTKEADIQFIMNLLQGRDITFKRMHREKNGFDIFVSSSSL